MTELVIAFGRVLALEGAVYALFPDAMRKMVARVLQEPTERVRYFGILTAAIGVGLVWLTRS